MTAARPWLVMLLAVLAMVFVTAPVGAHEAHEKAAAQKAAAEASAREGATAAQPEGAAQPGARASDHAMPMGHGMAMGVTPERPKTAAGRVARWLGLWHPVIVHFPIALFFLAAVLEAYAIAGRKADLLNTTRVLIAFGALGAVAAVGFGWLAMGVQIGKDDWIHGAHRWVGTGIAVLALATWWANERFVKVRGKSAGAIYASLLALTVAAILINGFLGSALVRGMDHMNY